MILTHSFHDWMRRNLCLCDMEFLIIVVVVMGNESNTQWVLTSLVSLLSSCSWAPTSALKPNFMVSSYTVFVSSRQNRWNTDQSCHFFWIRRLCFWKHCTLYGSLLPKGSRAFHFIYCNPQVIVDARLNKWTQEKKATENWQVTNCFCVCAKSLQQLFLLSCKWLSVLNPIVRNNKWKINHWF